MQNIGLSSWSDTFNTDSGWSQRSGQETGQANLVLVFEAHRFESIPQDLPVDFLFSPCIYQKFLEAPPLEEVSITMVSESGKSQESTVSSDDTVQVEDNTTYSTLEVHKGRLLEADPSSAPIVRADPDYLKIATYDDNNHKEIVVTETPLADDADADTDISTHNPEQRILGLKRKTFFITLLILIFIVIAAAVGGGVGGATVKRSKNETTKTSSPASPSSPSNSTASSTFTAESYANTGLAVMQWTDQSGILHKRLYYQDNANKVRESAWNNNTDFNTTWNINTISGSVKPGTPIAAVAGYPHASYNYTLVSLCLLARYLPNTI